MKLSRISLVIAIALVAIMALSVSANAFSNADLADYITTTHMIGGTQYKLTDANAVAAKDYILNHPLTDAEATQVRDLLEQAKALVNGSDSLANMSTAQKSEVVSLLKQAGSVAGLTVTVNTNNNTITVSDGTSVVMSGSYTEAGNAGLTVKYDNNGQPVTGGAAGVASNGGANTFVYTGANGSVFAVIALLAVVAVSTVLVKRAYAK